MSAHLKSHTAYKTEDVAKWGAAQIEAIRHPGAMLPAWLIGAFEDMKRETELSGASVTVSQADSEDLEDAEDEFFNFELVYFKVEKTVFTVIKDWLIVEGSPFQAMFALPAGGTTPALVEGTVKTNPIILEQTSAAGFRAFLTILYGPRGKPLQTYDEWVGALELAMRWNFDQVRKQAITGLDTLLPSLGPAARIILARRFSVGPWLRAGLIDLVTEVAEERLTRTALTDGTGFTLDMPTIANVFYACFALGRPNRHSIAEVSTRQICDDCNSGWGGSANCPSCKLLNDRSYTPSIVDGIFGAEIKACVYTEEL